MKYAITYKQCGIEKPEFKYDSGYDVAKAWFQNHHRNTSRLDMMVIGDDGKEYFPGYDGSFFLNTEN